MPIAFKAGQGAEEHVCPYCKTHFKQGDVVVACPHCQTLHHEACWEKNQKCANPECLGHRNDTTGYSTQKSYQPEAHSDTGVLEGGIFSGFLSVLFGIIMFFLNTGYSEQSEMYGGDAYTGIQNAAAQTANNVLAMGTIVKIGFAFLLISLGLIAIFYFTMKLKKAGN